MYMRQKLGQSENKEKNTQTAGVSVIYYVG